MKTGITIVVLGISPKIPIDSLFNRLSNIRKQLSSEVYIHCSPKIVEWVAAIDSNSTYSQTLFIDLSSIHCKEILQTVLSDLFSNIEAQCPSIMPDTSQGFPLSSSSSNAELDNRINIFTINNSEYALLCDVSIVVKSIREQYGLKKIENFNSLCRCISKYSSSNKISKTIINCVVDNDMSKHDQIDSNINKDSMSIHEDRGNHSLVNSRIIKSYLQEIDTDIQEKIIFLISMPRSGSTMLQKILEQSPRITSLSEPWVMLPLLTMYQEGALNTFYQHNISIFAKDELERTLHDATLIQNAQRAYADYLYSRISSLTHAVHFLDKTPRYMYIWKELMSIYPRSKYIILKRNPAAVISSYVHTWLNGDYTALLENEGYAHDVRFGFKSLAEFYALNYDNSFTVSYEEMVTSPSEICSKIFQFLKIEFDKSFIEYNTNKEAMKYYILGDQRTVYLNSKPKANLMRAWISRLKTQDDKNNMLNLLNMVPGGVISKLGYSRSEIIEQIQSTNVSGAPPETK